MKLINPTSFLAASVLLLGSLAKCSFIASVSTTSKNEQNQKLMSLIKSKEVSNCINDIKIASVAVQDYMIQTAITHSINDLPREYGSGIVKSVKKSCEARKLTNWHKRNGHEELSKDFYMFNFSSGDESSIEKLDKDIIYGPAKVAVMNFVDNLSNPDKFTDILKVIEDKTSAEFVGKNGEMMVSMLESVNVTFKKVTSLFEAANYKINFRDSESEDYATINESNLPDLNKLFSEVDHLISYVLEKLDILEKFGFPEHEREFLISKASEKMAIITKNIKKVEYEYDGDF